MARKVVEHLEGITVTAVYNQRQRDYLVYTTSTGDESVAVVRRTPQKPQSREWGVAWRTGVTTWHSTLGGALYAVGHKVRKDLS